MVAAEEAADDESVPNLAEHVTSVIFFFFTFCTSNRHDQSTIAKMLNATKLRNTTTDNPQLHIKDCMHGMIARFAHYLLY